MTSTALWPGPHQGEARGLFGRARESGLTPTRSQVLGYLGSFREAWAFRRTIAAYVGCSVRTVQRALTQGRELGLIGTARAKLGEIPPGLDRPVPCGWSHRWVIGWGKAGEQAKAAVHAARARWLVKHALPEKMTKPPAPGSAADPKRETRGRPEYQRRTWTPAELDAELERLAAKAKPPS